MSEPRRRGHEFKFSDFHQNSLNQRFTVSTLDIRDVEKYKNNCYRILQSTTRAATRQQPKQQPQQNKPTRKDSSTFNKNQVDVENGYHYDDDDDEEDDDGDNDYDGEDRILTTSDEDENHRFEKNTSLIIKQQSNSNRFEQNKIIRNSFSNTQDTVKDIDRSINNFNPRNYRYSHHHHNNNYHHRNQELQKQLCEVKSFFYCDNSHFSLNNSNNNNNDDLLLQSFDEKRLFLPKNLKSNNKNQPQPQSHSNHRVNNKKNIIENQQQQPPQQRQQCKKWDDKNLMTNHHHHHHKQQHSSASSSAFKWSMVGKFKTTKNTKVNHHIDESNYSDSQHTATLTEEEKEVEKDYYYYFDDDESYQHHHNWQSSSSRFHPSNCFQRPLFASSTRKFALDDTSSTKTENLKNHHHYHCHEDGCSKPLFESRLSDQKQKQKNPQSTKMKGRRGSNDENLLNNDYHQKNGSDGIGSKNFQKKMNLGLFSDQRSTVVDDHVNNNVNNIDNNNDNDSHGLTRKNPIMLKQKLEHQLVSSTVPNEKSVLGKALPFHISTASSSSSEAVVKVKSKIFDLNRSLPNYYSSKVTSAAISSMTIQTPPTTATATTKDQSLLCPPDDHHHQHHQNNNILSSIVVNNNNNGGGGGNNNHMVDATISSSSGCSTQSSSSSAFSGFIRNSPPHPFFHHHHQTTRRNNDQHHVDPHSIHSFDPHWRSISSSSTSASSSSISSSFHHHHSFHPTSRNAIRQEAAKNFRDFANDFEKGLISFVSCAENEGSLPSVELSQKHCKIIQPTVNDGNHLLKKSFEMNASASSNLNVTSNKNRKLSTLPSSSSSMVNIAKPGTVQESKQLIKQQPPSSLLSDGRIKENNSNQNQDKSFCESSKVDGRQTQNELFYHSLRLQLEKLRSLRDQYDKGYKCSEAIERLEKLTSKTRDCDREWKANEQKLMLIENELQSMIGCFKIFVEKIEGWARICPHDNYEIEFRHGKQRQVLRVKIGKSLERNWEGDRCEVTFRGALKPVIVCRVREIKTGWRLLSKRVVDIGCTSISMSELLEAVAKNCPILLDANPSGSLKLKILCKWQPNLDLNEILELQMNRKNSELSTPSTHGNIEMNSSNFSNVHESFVPKKSLNLSTSSLRSSHKTTTHQFNGSKFGINKELARSLLTLPTFIYEDNPFTLSDCSRSSTPTRISFGNKNIDPKLRKKNVHESSSFSCFLSSSLNSLRCDRSKIQNFHKTLADQNKTIFRMLQNLHISLEDYRGQFFELNSMSIVLNDLIDFYLSQVENSDSYFIDVNDSFDKGINNAKASEDDNNNNNNDTNQKQNSEFSEESFAIIDEAFEFLGSINDHDENGDMINCQEKLNKDLDAETLENLINNNLSINSDTSEIKIMNKPIKLPNHQQEILIWNSILILHLSSSLEHLNHVGSWILKGDEKISLARLQADTLAFRIFYNIFQSFEEENHHIDLILGQDAIVREFWNFMSLKIDRKKLFQYVYSFEKISNLFEDYISSNNLISNVETDQDFDIVRNSANWLASLFVSKNKLITILNIRTFFELELWQKLSLREEYNQNDSNDQITDPKLTLRVFFQIAIDLNRLIRIKTKKISLQKVEQILFERFNISCCWIPKDLTLTLITLLYEYHSNYEKGHQIKGRSTSEVKKSDRVRELSKIITNWLIWLVEDSRLEIREHVFFGLESACPLTRRASCFGMTYLFKLIKRIDDERKLEKYRTELPKTQLCNKEMDCLLYLSLEDGDSKVREEARRALKYLSTFSHGCLNELERSRGNYFDSVKKDKRKSKKIFYGSENHLFYEDHDDDDKQHEFDRNRQLRADSNNWKLSKFNHSMPDINLIKS